MAAVTLDRDSWMLSTDENPDWGFARNRQIMLRTPMAEYSASVFSAPIQVKGLAFYGGNRDCSWQGLLIGPIGGALYKTVDGIYFSTGSPLRASNAEFRPGELTYRYSDPDDEHYSVRITLTTLRDRVVLKALSSTPCWYTALLDLRPGEHWVNGTYSSCVRGGSAYVESTGAPIRVAFSGFDAAESIDLQMNWRYKLGDGFRRQDRDGSIAFVEHHRPVHAPLLFHSSTGKLEVIVPVKTLGLPPNHGPGARGDSVFGPSRIGKALQLRLWTLSTYGIPIDHFWLPEAGAWWFRKPWTRDALEGLRWNMKTYTGLLGWTEGLRSLLLNLSAICRSQRGLPLMLGEGCFASDAPPLLLGVASDFVRLTHCDQLCVEILDTARLAAETLLGGGTFSGCVVSDSVLCCPANSSWVDAVVMLAGRHWPMRLPLGWMDRGIDPFEPAFGLVEVNALYLESIKRMRDMCAHRGISLPTEIEELFSTLAAGFDETFRRNGMMPFDTVCPCQGLKDPTPSSPALVALSALEGLVFHRDEVERIWQDASQELLVYRRLQVLGSETFPFGVVVRAGAHRPYLGDEDYHGPTLWPRDVPYLVSLMQTLGIDVRGLLVNHLDHMLSEGVFGYCAELFSLPLGRSFTGIGTDNPVPVKNPAQYWSHWCDPYLDHLSELGLPDIRLRGR